MTMPRLLERAGKVATGVSHPGIGDLVTSDEFGLILDEGPEQAAGSQDLMDWRVYTSMTLATVQRFDSITTLMIIVPDGRIGWVDAAEVKRS